MVTKLHELIIYKKSTVWVLSFFQYFEQKIIDILSDTVALYKEPESLPKKL